MTPGTSRLVPLRCLKIAPKSAFKVSASGSPASNSRALPDVESAGAAAVLWGFWGTAAAGTAGAVQRGSWTMPANDYASTRYSDLREITPANAPRLRPVWTFSTCVLGGHEGQPLVVDNTMYVVTPYPNVLYAFDLT